MVAKITDPGETAQNVAPHLYTLYYLVTSNLYDTRLKLAKVLPCTAINCVQKSLTFDHLIKYTNSGSFEKWYKITLNDK